MSTYIVAFQVNNSAQKEKLKEKLKEYNSYCPINDNCWAIITDETPVQIRDGLSELVDASDRIFVIRSGTYSAWQNAYGEENTKWLKEYL